MPCVYGGFDMEGMYRCWAIFRFFTVASAFTLVSSEIITLSFKIDAMHLA